MTASLPAATSASDRLTGPRGAWHRWLMVPALVLLGALAVTAAALHRVDAPVAEAAMPPGLADPLPPVSPPPGLAFGVLQTAVSDGAAEALLVGRGRWWVQRRPVQVAVLVRHPGGTLLFDTGLGRAADAQFAANGLFHRLAFGYDRAGFLPVADQLDRAGWGVASVQRIVPSHMHWDHVSGLPDFPDAEVWVRPEERTEAARGHAPAFLQSQFNGVKHWRDLRFAGPPLLGFAASHDVFGDGSVVLLPLGGHTAGQVGLLLRLPSGRQYLFTGDVTWTLEGIARATDRSWLLRRLLPLDHDEVANRAVIAHLHQLMRLHPGITLVPAHDEHVLETLPRFPQLRG
ncbi:MAG: MBL fold metallo-hydrolase [Pseudomonadota bacterium]